MRVLLLSEARCVLQNVNRLVEDLSAQPDIVDLILICGSIANLKEEDRSVPALYSESEGDMSAVISTLENLHCRVAYVSGPLDPLSAWPDPPNPSPRLTPYSCNLHNRCIRLSPDLVLVGLGGAYAGEGREELLAHRLQHLLTQEATVRPGVSLRGLGDDTVREGDSVMLMTYMGPRGCDTVSGEEGHGGLAALLGEERTQRSMFLHMHASESREGKRGSVERVDVVSPGKLCNERYALLTLQREQGAQWRLGNLDLRELPAISYFK